MRAGNTTGDTIAKRIVSNSVIKTQTALDRLRDGSVILDKYGHAWQLGSIYWYRAYGDDSLISSHEVAQQYGPVTVIHEAAKREGVPVIGGY